MASGLGGWAWALGLELRRDGGGLVTGGLMGWANNEQTDLGGLFFGLFGYFGYRGPIHKLPILISGTVGWNPD